jgi:hypothetical protein
MNFLSPFRRSFLFIIFILFAISCSVFAQAPSSPPRPHQHPSLPTIDQEQFFAYWTTETGWTSELQLRNNAPDQDLVVTPALRLADGAETALAPVTINPQEVKSIDLDTAIAAATAPQLIGTYGSVVLRYRSPYAATLYAAMMVRRMGHAIAFHMDAMGESQDLQVGSREGIWWLPKDTTSDYLILSNQGQNTLPLDLSLFDASGKQARQKVLLAPAETTRYSIRKLILASGLTGSYGGIKISTSAHAGSLDTLHFLFDEAAGFSAILKMFDYDPNAKLEERDYARTAAWTLRAPMLALSNPDPALAFPPGTKLLPQLLLRNTTAKPIDAALRFNWRTAASTGKAPGPAVRLAPYETRRIDVAALQDASILPKEANWTSVTITTNSKPDELMAVAASYDSTLRYGAQTPFSDQLTYRWEGGMWEYDPYHSSIITAGNGGTKPTQAAFTIFYNQGTQRYDLEQTLQPDEQMWIDIGKLIREQVPDKNGKALPLDLTSGSYEFRDLTNTGVGTLFEGKVIYDKTYGHVAYGCAACCGYDALNPVLQYDPLSLAVGSTAGQHVDVPDMCQGGAPADVSTSFYRNWTTGSIATVDDYGTHTGVSAGSTTSQTSGFLNDNNPRLRCPAMGTNPRGGVNVKPTISGPNTVWFFANLTVSGYTTSAQLTANGGNSSTTWNVTGGADKITVSAFTGSSINVLSSGTAFSSSIGDVSLTATANGQTSNPFSITTRTPNLSVPGATNTSCDSTYGYITILYYAIKDQLLVPLPSNVPLNENWTSSVAPDYNGTNWVRPDPGFATSDVQYFQDNISGSSLSSRNPVPTCDGNSTAVQHWGQEWRIGTIATGLGRRIQTDTLQRYQAYGAHLSITSPAP